ncbi:hypothetical protein F4780DRAFT_94210 [Xylariomycetidae sp. FL0641]|nr:hypothetical protein F4780DRAFT_94210 [Xylariomycetidae sp. FL0641]
MAEHVEARSLAALNYLAANPPQYPKKPNEEKQDPLTLYISRVPGTRDIILSTLKPKLKNVTAEDVASSLYYIHLDVPEDEPLLPPSHPRGPAGSLSSRSSEDSPRSQISRKPIPAPSNQEALLVQDNVPAPALARENQVSQSGVPTGPPVSEPSKASGMNMPPTKGSIRRKPLDPKSKVAESLYEFPAITNQEELLPHPQATEGPALSLPPRPTETTHLTQSPEPLRAVASPPPSRSRPTSPAKRPFTPFSLTIIRRDPASGQQWNVGKVASFQLDHPEFISDEKQRQSAPTISIHLETSGYAKFRGLPVGAAYDARPSLDVRPGSASSSARLQVPDLRVQVPASGTFERQVSMTYTASFASNLKQRFRSRSSAEGGRPPSPTNRPGHSRYHSHSSIGSFGGNFEGSEPPTITQAAPGRKPRGYMFYSPWDGRCEFVTGNAGRSLKCRHVLPSFGGGVFNPLVDGEEGEFADEKVKNTRPVSELRFNLPSGELFAERRLSDGPVRARDQLRSQFNNVLAKAHGFEDSDEDYRMDLSLGKEKAGGGNRGKRAKMGKLIVFDEGLKMLDLAVAANVGLWWITWERTMERSGEQSPEPWA